MARNAAVRFTPVFAGNCPQAFVTVKVLLAAYCLPHVAVLDGVTRKFHVHTFALAQFVYGII